MSAIDTANIVAMVCSVLGACFSLIRLYIDWRRFQLHVSRKCRKMWLVEEYRLTPAKKRSGRPNSRGPDRAERSRYREMETIESEGGCFPPRPIIMTTASFPWTINDVSNGIAWESTDGLRRH